MTKRNENGHTAHVDHSDLEFLPGPTVRSTVDPGDDSFHFVEATHPVSKALVLGISVLPFFRLVPHEVLSDSVPALLRYVSFNATGFDLFQPLFDWRILLGIALENRAIFPLFEDRLKVERFDFESFEYVHVEYKE